MTDLTSDLTKGLDNLALLQTGSQHVGHRFYCPNLLSGLPQQQWSLHNKATDIVRESRDHKIYTSYA